MRSFYLTYVIIPQAVGLGNELPIVKIPWGHNALLLEKVKDLQDDLF